MGFAQVLQWVILLMTVTGLIALWIRNLRPPKDDSRLSKGLQLLQSKIAVLEDLSDRTETQVQQLNLLLEKKAKELQDRIIEADRCIQRIDQSALKSKEIAKLFEDKIPHKEIIERQNTANYVKAAKLANQGYSVSEICKQVNISPGEVEFISKVNKNQLMFCEESLPDWAKEEPTTNNTASAEETIFENFNMQAPAPQKDLLAEPKIQVDASKFDASKTEELKKLGDRFQQEMEKSESVKMTNGKLAVIKPVQFKKINLDQLG